MNDLNASVQLELRSIPSNVTLVRSVLAGFGEATGLDGALMDRIRTAVSEAANNVVLHAYDGDRPGSLRVSVATAGDSVDILVADRGHGIRPVLPTSERMGLGLAVISALSDRAEFLSAPTGGTEVRLAFSRDSDNTLPEAPESAAPGIFHAPRTSELSGDVLVSLARVDLAGQVLGRLTRALAAQHHFRVDRIAEMRTVTDSLADTLATTGQGTPVGCAITASDRRLELELGPLAHGTAAQLSEHADPAVLELIDEVSTETRDDGSELLRILICDAR